LKKFSAVDAERVIVCRRVHRSFRHAGGNRSQSIGPFLRY
jgi:hypothetical protein